MLAHRLRRWANIKPAIGQRVVFAGKALLATLSHWPNAGLMLGRRRTRWANIKPALVQRLLVAGYAVHPAFTLTTLECRRASVAER